MTSTDPQRTYFPRLDGLRAIAVSLVLVHHFGGPLAGFWDQGYYGVDLFFVISGYLITSILIASEGSFFQAYKTFLGRRTLRIFPVYYAALLAIYCFGLATSGDMLYLATYTWNYFAKTHGSPGNELFYLWSLSVEEQFYLVWPFVVLFLRRRLRLLVFLTFGIVLTGYAQLTINLFPSIAFYNYTGLLNRMGSLGLGGLGAILVAMKLIPLRIFRVATLELTVLGLLAWTQITDARIRFPLMGLCSLFLVMKCMYGEFHTWGLSAVLDHPKVRYLGRISYGVYVYHVPIAVLVTEYVFDPIWFSIPFEEFGVLSKLRWHAWIIKLPLFGLLTIALAGLSYRWLERPILALKDAWFSGRKAEVV